MLKQSENVEDTRLTLPACPKTTAPPRAAFESAGPKAVFLLKLESTTVTRVEASMSKETRVNIAPPLAAVLSTKELELTILIESETSCKKTAPPASDAVLLLKFVAEMVTLVAPEEMTAPPDIPLRFDTKELEDIDKSIILPISPINWAIAPPDWYYPTHIDNRSRISTSILYVSPDESDGTIIAKNPSVNDLGDHEAANEKDT